MHTLENLDKNMLATFTQAIKDEYLPQNLSPGYGPDWSPV